MPKPKSVVREALSAVMSDGLWHTQGEIFALCAHLIPPEVGYRTAQYQVRYKKKHGVAIYAGLTADEFINKGRLEWLRKTMRDMGAVADRPHHERGGLERCYKLAGGNE